MAEQRANDIRMDREHLMTKLGYSTINTGSNSSLSMAGSRVQIRPFSEKKHKRSLKGSESSKDGLVYTQEQQGKQAIEPLG
mmetsp:Transcript_4975/g.4182  ORF Transcript_4975/g.4182 Transcript_4975/m.4182 type:complete len:81 (+) Transcript_4975:1321-1563(+)